jgi:hypothetical protein
VKKQPKVILRKCPDYDVDRISGIIHASLLALGILVCRTATCQGGKQRRKPLVIREESLIQF